MKFLHWNKLRDWKTMEIDDSIPLIADLKCPCGRRLDEFLTLRGRKNIRLGTCQWCGYIGYIDKPTENWIQNFYANTFAADKNKKGRMISPNKERILEKVLKMQNIQSIFEIGAGYGEIQKWLKNKGYEVSGCEPSDNRRLVSQVPYRLLSEAPGFYHFIFSFHVLEHVYNPQTLIQECSKKQKEGDLLLIVIPNIEPAMMTVFFLPHLHKFTESTISTLVANYGYDKIYSEYRPEELVLLYKKSPPPAYILPNNSPTGEILKKHILKNYFLSKRIMWWYRPLGYDISGSFPAWLGNWGWRYIWWRHKTPIQSCLVNYDKNQDIEFENNVILAYK